VPGRAEPAVAFIDGQACTLEEAVAAAAERLRRSRLAVFAGLGCDVDGVRSVVRLARRIGGAIDHLGGTAYGAEIQALRDAGFFLTSPAEARVRADCILVIGPGAFRDGAESLRRICDQAPRLAAPQASRSIIWLGSQKLAARDFEFKDVLPIAVPSAQLQPTLATLRAHLAGRPVRSTSLSVRRLDAVGQLLRRAQFGVAIWACGDLDALGIETLTGLMRDLNRTTRFTCLPLIPDDNAAGAAMALTWLTGFPSNICFARDAVDFDPWRFDAARLAASGEADLAIWISAFRETWPDWASQIEVISLGRAGGGRARPRCSIEIEVGIPGVDHDSVHMSAASGSLAVHCADKPGGAPSVAEVLGSLEARLDRPRRARR
jgi:formylmethanofuran dehydrogenase subunit B